MHHQLKIQPAYFEAVLSGDKNFEIRDDSDREFQKGDTVELLETRAGITQALLTGRTIDKRITYVTGFKQREGYVVFGMEDLPKETTGEAE